MSQMSNVIGDWDTSESIIDVSGFGAIVLACKANPDRWAIAFSVRVGTVTIATNRSTFDTANAGIAVSLTNSPFVMSYRDWSALINQPWYAKGEFGAQSMTVWEVSKPR